MLKYLHTMLKIASKAVEDENTVQGHSVVNPHLKKTLGNGYGDAIGMRMPRSHRKKCVKSLEICSSGVLDVKK